MKKVSIWVSIILILLLSGCSQKEPSLKSKKIARGAMIVWKTATVQYADMGFISDSSDLITIEIYGVGSALMRLKIYRDRVCMSQFQCMSKKEFNRKQLSPHYPAELLTYIFRNQGIFDEAGVTREGDGFTQRLKKEEAYDILYSVTKQETLFEDRLNGIVIKIKNRDSSIIK